MPASPMILASSWLRPGYSHGYCHGRGPDDDGRDWDDDGGYRDYEQGYDQGYDVGQHVLRGAQDEDAGPDPGSPMHDSWYERTTTHR